MEVDARVPPLPHYQDSLPVAPPRFPEQHPEQDSPPLRPPLWEPQRMPAPSPWMPGMAPPTRGNNEPLSTISPKLLDILLIGNNSTDILQEGSGMV